MGSWTLGGYPSKSISLVNEVFSNNNFDINNWLRINFVDDERFVKAIDELSKGFEKYPFSVDNLYFGPKTLGPANLWDLENKLNSSMVCFSRNDYQKWINPFKVENYLLDYENYGNVSTLKKLTITNILLPYTLVGGIFYNISLAVFYSIRLLKT